MVKSLVLLYKGKLIYIIHMLTIKYINPFRFMDIFQRLIYFENIKHYAIT